MGNYQSAQRVVRALGMDVVDGLALTFSCTDYPAWVRNMNGWSVEDVAAAYALTVERAEETMKNQAKHTVGPWRIRNPIERRSNYPEIEGADGHVVCDLRANGHNAPEKRGNANATLIAAAPEMLEVLKLLDSLETRMDHGDTEAEADWPHAMSQVRFVIAKAKG